MCEPARFVQDGYRRACMALEPLIRSQLLEEYAERLAGAGDKDRDAILQQIEREIRRRLDEQAPPDALY